jgi:hypothetical protein
MTGNLYYFFNRLGTRLLHEKNGRTGKGEMKVKNNKTTHAAGLFLCLLVLLLPFSIYAASCTPVSANICVGADDEAYVWINGNPVDDGTHFYAVQVGQPVPCAPVPVTDISATGNNDIAVKNPNVIAGFVWASWVLDITCFDGSHTYITSSDGTVSYFNQSTTASAPPANDGSGHVWYDPAYNDGGTWGMPVSVTNPAAIYDSPVKYPPTGLYLNPLSYSGSAGDNPGNSDEAPAGQVLYFRQSFSFLQPVAISKTISKTTIALGETFTYCFDYSNPEAVARTFDLWDTIPAVTDFVGCDHACAVQTFGSNVVIDWPITVPANGSGTVCAWVAANRYP